MDRATQHADNVPDAINKTDARQGHAFIDKNRRTPYICGICGRDIKHPVHQPTLTGFTANDTTAPAQDPELDTWAPTREESQMKLF